MADFVRVPEADWQDILDAVRGKTGGAEKMLSGVVAQAIASIEAGGGSGDNNAIDALVDRSITEIKSNATIVGQYAFRGCTSLKSVTMPNVERLQTNAFTTCTSLETINLPNWKNGSGYEFSGCSELVEAVVPKLTGFSSCTFQNCFKLVRVYSPNVQGANANAFQNATSIEELDILGGGALGTNAFNGASKLSRLVIRNNTTIEKMQNVSAFTGTPFASGGTGGTVYVPQALITEYQNATNWSTLYAAGTCNFVAIEGSEYE